MALLLDLEPPFKKVYATVQTLKKAMALREESRRDYATCDQKHDGGSPSIPPCAGSSSSGSSVVGAAINLFNSTIGAGE